MGTTLWEPLFSGLRWVGLKVRSLWSWEDLPSVWTRGGSSSMSSGLGQSSPICSWGSYRNWRARVTARTSCQRPDLFWSHLIPSLMPPFWMVKGPETSTNPRKCWAGVVFRLSMHHNPLGQGCLENPDCWAPPTLNFGMVGLGWWWLRMSVPSKFPGDADRCFLAKRIKRFLCSYDWGREAGEKDVSQESLSRDWEFTWCQTKISEWLDFCKVKD